MLHTQFGAMCQIVYIIEMTISIIRNKKKTIISVFFYRSIKFYQIPILFLLCQNVPECARMYTNPPQKLAKSACTQHVHKIFVFFLYTKRQNVPKIHGHFTSVRIPTSRPILTVCPSSTPLI